MKLVIIAFFMLLTMGCNNGGGSQKKEINVYFDLEGLLKRQLPLLDSLNPIMHKTAIIGEVAESKTLQLDSLSWARELSIFFQADINELALKDKYNVIEKATGKQRIKIFKAKEKKETGVEYLKIYFYPATDKVHKIEAFYREKNALYNSQRKMTLSFKMAREQKPLLTSYNVKGKQKMILKDPVAFLIDAVLVY